MAHDTESDAVLTGEETIVDGVEEAIEESRKRERRRALLQDPMTDDVWGQEYRFRDALAVAFEALNDDRAHSHGCTGYCETCMALERIDAIIECREQ